MESSYLSDAFVLRGLFLQLSDLYISTEVTFEGNIVIFVDNLRILDFNNYNINVQFIEVSCRVWLSSPLSHGKRQ